MALGVKGGPGTEQIGVVTSTTAVTEMQNLLAVKQRQTGISGRVTARSLTVTRLMTDVRKFSADVTKRLPAA